MIHIAGAATYSWSSPWAHLKKPTREPKPRGTSVRHKYIVPVSKSGKPREGKQKWDIRSGDKGHKGPKTNGQTGLGVVG